jgi:polyprenyl-phospho-N-acetylgalactosaminyl synthase
MKDHRVSVVVPAYNESRAIADVLSGLTRLPYDIVVVDDGSVDHTTSVALQFPVVVLRHSVNLGQGAALQTGITFALAHWQPLYIVTMDSDGQHCMNDIPRLLGPLESGDYDVVLGSRFLPNSDTVSMNPRKRIFLKLAVAFTNLTTGLTLTDTHNGLRGFSADAARRINITQNRMAHASEILSYVAILKLRYCEVPVDIKYTPYSVAKGQRLLNSINILWDILAGKIR